MWIVEPKYRFWLRKQKIEWVEEIVKEKANCIKISFSKNKAKTWKIEESQNNSRKTQKNWIEFESAFLKSNPDFTPFFLQKIQLWFK